MAKGKGGTYQGRDDDKPKEVKSKKDIPPDTGEPKKKDK